MANLVERQIGPGPVPVWDIQTASASQIDACCGLGKGVNLLDNWWLGTGIINQRGITGEADNETYQWHIAFDRWNLYSRGTWELTPSGIKLSNVGGYSGGYWTLAQVMDKLGPRSTFPKPYQLTYSVLIDDQLYSTTFSPVNYNLPNITLTQNLLLSVRYSKNENYPTIELVVYQDFLSSPITIQAVKLEIGTEQTLAHKEGNIWVLNDPPPNPQQELTRCQFYYNKILWHPISFCYIAGYISGFSFPRMRAAPSISFKSQDPNGNTVNPVPQQMHPDGIDYFKLTGSSPGGIGYVLYDIVLDSEL